MITLSVHFTRGARRGRKVKTFSSHAFKKSPKNCIYIVG